jgi:hypothetical protein
MSCPMNQTGIIRARVEPRLAEQFALAARLRGRTASAALRELMQLYVEQTSPPNSNGAPEGAVTSDTPLTLSKAGVDEA